MKRWIQASTNTVSDHIKIALFDYAAEDFGEIAGIPLTEVVERIEAIENSSDVTVDDIIDYMYEEGEDMDEALIHFEEMIETVG